MAIPTNQNNNLTFLNLPPETLLRILALYYSSFDLSLERLDASPTPTITSSPINLELICHGVHQFARESRLKHLPTHLDASNLLLSSDQQLTTFPSPSWLTSHIKSISISISLDISKDLTPPSTAAWKSFFDTYHALTSLHIAYHFDFNNRDITFWDRMFRCYEQSGFLFEESCHLTRMNDIDSHQHGAEELPFEYFNNLEEFHNRVTAADYISGPDRGFIDDLADVLKLKPDVQPMIELITSFQNYTGRQRKVFLRRVFTCHGGDAHEVRNSVVDDGREIVMDWSIGGWIDTG